MVDTTRAESADAPNDALAVDNGPRRSAVAPDIAKPFRALLRRLSWPGDANGNAALASTIGVTSCRAREGVTTCAAQLALVAAETRQGDVLLVDASGSATALHELFGGHAQPGLTDVLADLGGLDEAIQRTPFENLDLLPIGSRPRRRGGGDSTEPAVELTRRLTNDYALVVVDLPPAGERSRALRLSGILDGVLLVIAAEEVQFEMARRTIEMLRKCDAHVLGAILNKRRRDVPRWVKAS